MKTLGVIVAVVVVVLVLLWGSRGPIVSAILTSKLGVPTTVESFTFGPNHLTIKGIRMDNPKGATFPVAFSAERILVQDLLQFFGDQITIGAVVIEKGLMTVETYNAAGSDNNWSRLFKALESKEEEDEKAAQPSKRFLLKKLQFVDLQVKAKLALLNGQIIQPAPMNMTFTDLGSGKPLPTARLVGVVMQAALQQMMGLPDFQNGLQGVFKSTGDFLQNTLQAPAGLFKNLFGQ